MTRIFTALTNFLSGNWILQETKSNAERICLEFDFIQSFRLPSDFLDSASLRDLELNLGGNGLLNCMSLKELNLVGVSGFELSLVGVSGFGRNPVGVSGFELNLVGVSGFELNLVGVSGFSREA
ncbi:hypothetical protein FEM48_Zijuj04G0088700 [Ziziphus jujuba var. spinosa]|uniref:Uncharacterized protein n=1 Tax=Ziziphus jujuba var. spinosa TaxID=714518 RepID=A0A978VIY0_ZIZJJ|nr:hypothetical protein FEM48_Zijuj04G0088700 [Ziziphus jujuba var. spinosa]